MPTIADPQRPPEGGLTSAEKPLHLHMGAGQAADLRAFYQEVLGLEGVSDADVSDQQVQLRLPWRLRERGASRAQLVVFSTVLDRAPANVQLTVPASTLVSWERALRAAGLASLVQLGVSEGRLRYRLTDPFGNRLTLDVSPGDSLDPLKGFHGAALRIAT